MTSGYGGKLSLLLARGRAHPAGTNMRVSSSLVEHLACVIKRSVESIRTTTSSVVLVTPGPPLRPGRSRRRRPGASLTAKVKAPTKVAARALSPLPLCLRRHRLTHVPEEKRERLRRGRRVKENQREQYLRRGRRAARAKNEGNPRLPVTAIEKSHTTGESHLTPPISSCENGSVLIIGRLDKQNDKRLYKYDDFIYVMGIKGCLVYP